MIHLLICKKILLPLASSPGGENIRGRRDKPSIPIRRRRKFRIPNFQVLPWRENQTGLDSCRFEVSVPLPGPALM